MSTKSKWSNGILTFFDGSTFENVHPMAPIIFYEDFLGYQFMASEAGSAGRWHSVQVALNTAMAVRADTANGVLAMIIDADSNAEDAVLYWGDQRGISVKQGAIFETVLDVAVLPTTGVCGVFGMATDHNLAKDTVACSAWFRLDASGVLKVETDDTTNNNDDKATGITLVAGTANVFRIDFTTIADVKFYVDGVGVATSTTFDMSNLTAAEAVMQPYFSLDKASGTGVGTFDVDAVRIWSNRS